MAESWYSVGILFCSNNINPNVNFMDRVQRKNRRWAPEFWGKADHHMKVTTCTASERPAKAIQQYWPFHLPQFDLVGLAWFINVDLASFIKCNFDIVTDSDNLSLTSSAIVELLVKLVWKLAHCPKLVLCSANLADHSQGQESRTEIANFAKLSWLCNSASWFDSPVSLP